VLRLAGFPHYHAERNHQGLGNAHPLALPRFRLARRPHPPSPTDKPRESGAVDYGDTTGGGSPLPATLREPTPTSLSGGAFTCSRSSALTRSLPCYEAAI
jgi:hypothetical protein